MKRHRTNDLGPLHCCCSQNGRQLACQRTGKMAVAAMLEAQKRLGQCAAVGKRSERLCEGKWCSPASAAESTSLCRHGAARTAGPELDQANIAVVAEADAFRHEGIAASTAGWPKDGENAVEKHNDILGSSLEIVVSDSAWRGARGRGTLTPV